MRTSHTIVLLAAVVAVTAAVAAAPAPGGSGAGTAATKSVSVDDDFFRPKAARVSRGDKVVWRWRGSGDHNVRFRSAPKGAKRPRGSRTRSGGRFARTFSRRGTFRYVCTIHEDLGMKGRVVVE